MNYEKKIEEKTVDAKSKVCLPHTLPRNEGAAMIIQISSQKPLFGHYKSPHSSPRDGGVA